MKSRILTALVLIPPVTYLIGWGPLWLFMMVLVLVVERSFYEYIEIARAAGAAPHRALGCLFAGALCLAPVAGLGGPNLWFPVALLLGLITASLSILWTRDFKHSLRVIAATVFGVFYLGVTLPTLLPLRFGNLANSVLAPSSNAWPASLRPGGRLMLFLFLVLWAGDIFAYFVGRGIGRHHFAPHISPKKTVEGSIGGLAGSLLIGWIMARVIAPTWDSKTVLLLAGLVAVAGQVGDLVESALKRAADVKDSGSLLPGHGGLLDRIDSLIFAAPVLWLALTVNEILR